MQAMRHKLCLESLSCAGNTAYSNARVPSVLACIPAPQSSSPSLGAARARVRACRSNLPTTASSRAPTFLSSFQKKNARFPSYIISLRPAMTPTPLILIFLGSSSAPPAAELASSLTSSK